MVFLSGVTVALLGQSVPVYAFDKQGHQTIEYLAYKKLRATPDGTQVLNKLREWGFLRNAAQGDTLDLLTASPDLSSERQFLQERQMYHFMSSMEDVKTAAEESALAARQQTLMRLALPGCYAFMYVLYDELMTKKPVGSSQAGRGIYVLMHAAADSYSREHSTRDAKTKEIITVKSWELFTKHWPAGALEAVSAPTQDQHATLALLHRGNTDNADEEWQHNGKITQTGQDAVDALVDLLQTVYRGKNKPSDSGSFWKAYIEKHFTPQGGTFKGTGFELPGNPTVNLQVDYADNIQNGTLTVYDFDRHQRWALMAVGQTGFREGSAYGVELSFMNAPRRADLKKTARSAWAQTSKGYVIGLSEIPYRQGGESDAYGRALQLKALGAAQWALPRHDVYLQLRAGIGMLPYPTPHKGAFVGGIDLTRTFGKDFYLFGVNMTFRSALGYEFNSSGLPAHHTLCLRIGFQTWHTGISFQQ